VQPIPTADKQPRSCARGHYFVQIADRDHVFFEYAAKETGAAVGEMFRGFSGYIQADAKSVYDALFRQPDQRPAARDDAEPDLAERHEVGCWSHARRKFWEATITKDPVAREGLVRIGRIFELDRSWRKKPLKRSSRCATRTCARTPTRSSRGSLPSSSACAASAVSCAPRSATRTGSRAR
ncbi:MAG: transposase, partial [Deltaproteobacteria bacterium]|nr:transposase [Deltaproteobacteria bacterium]